MYFQRWLTFADPSARVSTRSACLLLDVVRASTASTAQSVRLIAPLSERRGSFGLRGIRGSENGVTAIGLTIDQMKPMTLWVSIGVTLNTNRAKEEEVLSKSLRLRLCGRSLVAPSLDV